MADHLNRDDKMASERAAQPTAVRISPWKVLESLSKLRIDMRRIEPLETKSWGRGGNADVIPAKLTPAEVSEPSRSSDVQHVAVKKMRLDGDDNYNARVLAVLALEVSLLNDLSHPSIVKLIGFVEDAKNGIAWIILPWEKNGNLREFVASAAWEFPERLSLIHDVAKGIDYLHTRVPPICHGDLKSLNVLVNSKNKAVLTDFGSARSLESMSGEAPQSQAPNVQAAPDGNTEVPQLEVACEASGTTITLTGFQWTLRWAAPELLVGSPADLATDIWAFGWICWEARRQQVMTSNFPFEGNNDVSVVVQIIHGNVPSVHGDGRLDQVMAFANLIIDCWSLHPSKRPTAQSCEQQVYWMDRSTPYNRGESSEIRSARLLSSIAYMHISHNRLGEAMDLLLRAMDIARSTKDEWATANAHERLGDIHRLRGEFSDAQESAVAARDIYARIGDQAGLANALYALADVCRMRGDYSQAEESCVAARDIYARIGDQTGRANAVDVLGDIYCSRGELSKAEESFITARDIYAAIGYQAGLARAIYGLAEVYRLRGEYSKAEEACIAFREIYARIGYTAGLAAAAYVLAEIYRSREEYMAAEECYVAARDIYARIGDQAGLANIAYGLAEVHRMRGEYSKAEEGFVAAQDIYAQIGDQSGLGNAVKSLGDVHYSRGEHSKAEESYLTARDIYVRIGDHGGTATAVAALGDLYQLREEYSKAEESYRALRDIYTQLEDESSLANVTTKFAQLFTKQENYAEAEQLYHEARRLYAKTGNKFSLADNLWLTGWLYANQKRYEEAESVVSESSTLFRELGLEERLLDCDDFLVAVKMEYSGPDS